MSCTPGPVADRDDLTDSFLALVDEAFRRLLDEPGAHLHVTGFAEDDVAFVLTRDGLEARRRAEVYGPESYGDLGPWCWPTSWVNHDGVRRLWGWVVSGFRFESGETYLMPGHFGPRTAEDDGRYDQVMSTVIIFTTDGDRAARLLPPGFELTDPPTVIVVHAENRGVHFMAGRGYNLVGVNLGCRYQGESDEIDGSYALVMWEDQFLPVVLGREFIGAPKFVADVPDATLGEGQRRFAVSEYGTKLLDGEVTGLVGLGDDECAQIEQQFNDGSWMGWRLLPTPDARGVEVSYPTVIDLNRTLDAAWMGTGTVSFHAATRDQAPISHLVASTLAQLPVIETQAAIVTHGTLYQGHARRLN